MKKLHTIYLENTHWSGSPNLVLCSRIYHFLTESGHRIFPNPSLANFIIISSCGALKNIEDKSITLYHKYHHLKKGNAVIIMFGCLTKTNEKRLQGLDICLVCDYDDDNIEINVELKQES